MVTFLRALCAILRGRAPLFCIPISQGPLWDEGDRSVAAWNDLDRMLAEWDKSAQDYDLDIEAIRQNRMIDEGTE